MGELNILLSLTTLISCFPATLCKGHALWPLLLSRCASPIPHIRKPSSGAAAGSPRTHHQAYLQGVQQGKRVARASPGAVRATCRGWDAELKGTTTSSWEWLEEEQVLAPLAGPWLQAAEVCGHWMPLNIFQCPQDKVNWWLRQNSVLCAVILRSLNSWSTNFVCLCYILISLPTLKAVLCWQKVPCWRLRMTQELNLSPQTGRGEVAALFPSATVVVAPGSAFPRPAQREPIQVVFCQHQCQTEPAAEFISPWAAAYQGPARWGT